MSTTYRLHADTGVAEVVYTGKISPAEAIGITSAMVGDEAWSPVFRRYLWTYEHGTDLSEMDARANEEILEVFNTIKQTSLDGAPTRTAHLVADDVLNIAVTLWVLQSEGRLINSEEKVFRSRQMALDWLAGL